MQHAGKYKIPLSKLFAILQQSYMEHEEVGLLIESLKTMLELRVIDTRKVQLDFDLDLAFETVFQPSGCDLSGLSDVVLSKMRLRAHEAKLKSSNIGL